MNQVVLTWMDKTKQAAKVRPESVRSLNKNCINKSSLRYFFQRFVNLDTFVSW